MFQHIVIILNSITAVTLNSTLFVLSYNYQSLRSDFNNTILSTCLADILVSLQMLALAITALIGDNILEKSLNCDVNGFVSLTGFVASVIGLAASTCYRAIMICKHDTYRKYLSGSGTKFYVLASWLFSLTISLPPLIGWSRFAVQEGMFICFVEWKSDVFYTVFMVFICFVSPIIAIMASLRLIIKKYRTVTANLQQSGGTPNKYSIEGKILQARKKKSEQTERKITFSIFMVALTFFFAWGPFVIVIILETTSTSTIPDWFKALGIILGCINSTANPIIHLTMNGNFKAAAIKTFRKIAKQTK